MFSYIMLIESRPGCLEAAASIIGDKWTPLLVRALSSGPLGFCDLQKAAGGINPRTLSARLTMLEQQVIVVKVFSHTTQLHAKYTLTPKGNDLVPVLQSMANWGEKYPTAS